MTISHFSLIFAKGISRLSLHDGILGTWKKERNVGLKKLQNLYLYILFDVQKPI